MFCIMCEICRRKINVGLKIKHQQRKILSLKTKLGFEEDATALVIL